MRRIAITAVAAFAAALCLVQAVTARAALTPEPITGFFGDEVASPNLVVTKNPGTQATNAVSIVYDNSTAASPANFGFSSADPAATFGDELFTTGTGLLSSHKFSLFNGSTGSTLLTASVSVSFFNGVTSALLGSYTTSVNFGAGLPGGSFSTISVTGIDPLLILINTTDVIVLQTVTAKTGTAVRVGIASRNPPTVGSSIPQMFISATDVGAAGFYNIGTAPNFLPANPVNQVGLSPPPVGVHSKSWSEIKQLYR